jgi:RimJ/RimL family protein N-acetyltransferase
MSPASRWRLETARLVLRPFRAGDFEALYAVWRDPEVMRYISPTGWPHSLEVSRGALDTLAGEFARRGFGQWAVVERGGDAVMGYCGFKATADRDVGELLYGLAPACWGRGYATEAALAALDYGFARAGFRRVVASAMVGNGASIRVLEKAGLARERIETIDGRDEVVFGLDRRRHRASKPRHR